MSDEILNNSDGAKKAIKVQDLAYVKEYINRKQTAHEAKMTSKYDEFTNDIDAKHEAFTNEMTAKYEEFTEGVDNVLGITQDENGVLRIGDVVIPQRKLLWCSGQWKWNDNLTATMHKDNAVWVPLSDTIQPNDTLEIVCTCIAEEYICRKIKVTEWMLTNGGSASINGVTANATSSRQNSDGTTAYAVSMYGYEFQVWVESNRLGISPCQATSLAVNYDKQLEVAPGIHGRDPVGIYSVYKVIE